MGNILCGVSVSVMADRVGKTYFVTGAASGLGMAVVSLLCSQGANAVVADLNLEGAKKVAAEHGPRAIGLKVDVTCEESVKSAIHATIDHFKGLHGVINCAGVPPAMTTVSRKNEPHCSKTFDFSVKLNLYGTFLCSAAGAAAM